MIQLKNVTKRFQGAVVLSNLSFTVEEGTTVALLGLSGSGKTTALKIVCGLHMPDEGEVIVQGKTLRCESIDSLRRNLGYVIQDGGLFPHLTAYGNLALVAQEVGWNKEQIQKRVIELAELTRISPEVLQRYPRELSGGQKQRIGIMRALFLDPPILLLDEPLGALDPITRSDLRKDFRELFARLGKTVLLVTHDLFEAGQLAGKILLLDQGKIAQAGSMQELVRNPANEFVRRFVGSQHAGESL